MHKKIIWTPNAPQPKGPYSQAVSYNNILYVSGQIPVDPKSGEIVSGGIEVQARRVLENLKVIVEESGGKMTDVLKTTCYLTNLDEFEGFNKIYAEYFPSESPARTTLQAAKLPANARLEIDAIIKLNPAPRANPSTSLGTGKKLLNIALHSRSKKQGFTVGRGK